MSVTLRYRLLKKKGHYSAYLDIYENYKREYEYLNIYVSHDYNKVKRIKEEDKEKVELADSIRLKKELALKSNEYGFGNSQLKKVDFYSYFNKIAEKKGHHSYGNTLSKIKAFAGENLTFAQITEGWVADFIKYMTKDVSENTAIHYLKMLGVVLNCAIRERILRDNPIKFVPPEEKPRKIVPKREFLEIEELRALHKTAFPGNPQIGLAFIFSCYTGLRISDLKKLKWSEVEGGLKEIRYRQKKSGSEFHHLPLADDAIEIVKNLPKPKHSDFVFWNLPASGSHCNTILRLWAAQAGVKKHLHWHCGRHTYACLLLANGVDLYTVSKLLGHASIRQTEVYAQIVNERKKAAVAAIPKLNVKE